MAPIGSIGSLHAHHPEMNTIFIRHHTNACWFYLVHADDTSVPRLVGRAHQLCFHQQGEGVKGVHRGAQPVHHCVCAVLDAKKSSDNTIAGATTISGNKHRAATALTPLAGFEMLTLHTSDLETGHVCKISRPNKTHGELLVPGGYVELSRASFKFYQWGWLLRRQVLLVTDVPRCHIDLQNIRNEF